MRRRFLALAAGLGLASFAFFQLLSCSGGLDVATPEPPGSLVIEVREAPPPAEAADAGGAPEAPALPREGGEPSGDGAKEPPDPFRLSGSDSVHVFVLEGLGTVLADQVLTFDAGSSTFRGSIVVSAGNNRVVSVEVFPPSGTFAYEFGLDTDVDVIAGQSTTASILLGQTTPTGVTPASVGVGAVDVTWNPVTIVGLNDVGTVYTVREFRNGSPAGTFTVQGSTRLSRTGLVSGDYTYTVRFSNAYAGTRSVTGPVSSTSSPLTVSNDLPVLSSVTPTSGRVGDTVTIAGSFLDNGPDAGKPLVVFAGGAQGQTSAVTATSLDVVVPLGGQTGDITVTNDAGASTIAFDVEPTLVDFTPRSGTSGQVVTIHGYNLQGTATTVSVGGVSWNVTRITPTEVDAEVNAASPTALIVIDVDGFTDTSLLSFTVLRAPSISSVAPADAIAGATVLQVLGPDLVGTGMTVEVGGAPSSFTVVSNDSGTGDDEISVSVPPGATGSGIRVDHDGGMVTSAQPTLYPHPLITGFEPDTLVLASNPDTMVTIFGTFFPAAADSYAVTFTRGALDTTVTALTTTGTSLAVKVPATATTGKIKVRLTVSGFFAEETTATDLIIQ